ncbi:MAG: phospho-N-acetylmuramoyl-pentapeptide-transferase [Candidatus Aenigmatarchaeota archaeon]
MFYHIFYPLSEYFFIFNIFKYITFRGGCAFITSFFIIMLLWKFTLKKLKSLEVIEKIDMYGHVHLEKIYQNKKGTPTMGGVLIIFSIIISTLLWTRWNCSLMWLSFFIIISLGLLGLVDDFKKLKKGRGLSRTKKLIFQIIIGLILGILISVNKNLSTKLHFPFFKNFVLELGYFYLLWSALIIVSTSNAVNFTDGLDGLAMGGIITNTVVFAFVSYLSGHINFANYLFIPYIRDAGELVVFILSLAGACLGFLWFNSYPAEIFMGDVGSLALGGIIGAIALFIKKEFLLFISGGLFVVEAISVILQILSVKLRGKRLFLAAPLHHHFQILGWKESKITIRFWIFSIICGVVAILTIKLQ